MQLTLLAIDGAPEPILIPRQLPQQGNAFPVDRAHAVLLIAGYNGRRPHLRAGIANHKSQITNR